MSFTHTDLSDREKEILRLVATGASNKEIALKLHISTNTVKVHLRHIFNKIEVSSRTEAAMYAVNAGIVGESHTPIEAPKDVPVIEVTPVIEKTKWSLGRIIGILIIVLLVIITMLFFPRSPQVTRIQDTSDSPRWKYLSPMPTPRYSLGVAAYADNLYAIGGKTSKGTIGVLERFNTITNSWSVGRAKPIAVSEIGAAVISGRIFVPGGRLDSGEVTDVLEIYDPVEDSWSTGSPLIKGLSAYAIATFEAKLYLIGGWDGNEFVNSIFEYDSTRDTWQEVTQMITPRGYAGAAVAGGNILILGGYDGKEALSTIETFEPNSGKIKYSPLGGAVSMPESAYGMGVTSLADMVYIVGGQGNEERQYPALIMFNETGEWGAFEAPGEENRIHLSLVSWGTYIYAIGGEVNNIPTNENMSYKAIYTVIFPLIR